MKTLKLKLVTLLAVSLCFFLMGVVTMNTAPKYVEATTQAQTIIENDDGFYMGKGAQVRIPTTVQDGYDATGIRFTVNLQAEYITQLNSTYQDVTFYSIIAINGAEAVVPETFTGESDTTVIGNVALLKWAENDYGKLLDGWYTRNITPTNMQKGFDIALTVRAVAKVVKADNSVDYLYAKLNDNTRTMEAVALESYLDNADDPDYAYLNKYYGTATPYTGGYAEETGESVVSFVDNLTNVELSDNAYACVGASPVDLTDGVVNLDSSVANLEVGKTYNVSIFDGDKVYTKPMMYVTQTINEASDLSVFELVDKDITGYYVVTEDIDASGVAATWHTDFKTDQNGVGAYRGFSYKFKGVFDGNGHTVKANVTYGGLFGVLEDATITNTHFVLNVGGNYGTSNNTGNRITGLAKTAINSTISNVYAELNTGADIAPSRNWAISLIQDSPNLDNGYLMLENVVVKNNDAFASLTVDSGWYTVGALFYTDSGRAFDTRDDYMKNVYVIAPKTFGADNSGYVAMASGSEQATFASNDTESKNAVDALITNNTFYQFANATRYNTTFDFVKGLAWENKIPDFIMKDLLDDGTIVSVGETKIVNNGEVELPLNVAQAVALSIGSKALTNVELSSEDDCITISGTSLTLTKVGTATVTATGKFDDMTVTVTFTVSLDADTYEGKVLFSGMDGDVDVKTIFGEGAVLASAYDSEGASYTVTEGKISGLTNTTNAPVEKTFLLGTTANEWKYVTFTVYTKIIDDASDLSVFELIDKDITGYYIVTEDIDASEEAVIAHSGFVNATTGYTYKFKGVFDGNGHTIKANVQNGGLFGSLQDANVYGANFVFNISQIRIVGDNFPVGLAYKSSNSTISNIYAELNIGNDVTAANSRSWALSLLIDGGTTTKIENVVVVNNDDFETLLGNTTKHWVGGALIYADGARTSNVRNTHRTNIYLIAPERLGNATDGYSYYVPLSGGTTGQGFASNDAVGKADAATKTGATQYTYNYVIRYNTVADFVKSLAWEGKIPDFIMDGLVDNDVATVKIGETEIANNGEIAVELGEAQTLTLNVGTKVLSDVTLTSEDDCVTISDNTFTLTQDGTATITVTGKLAGATAGKTWTLSVTFTVSLVSNT